MYVNTEDKWIQNHRTGDELNFGSIITFQREIKPGQSLAEIDGSTGLYSGIHMNYRMFVYEKLNCKKGNILSEYNARKNEIE